MEESIRPSYYAILDADVRYDTRLSSTAKLIYAEITALTHKEGYAWASNKYFADNFKLSASQVSRIMTQLSKLGYINVYIKDNYVRKITLRKNDKPLRKNAGGVTQKAQRGVTQKAQDNTTSINTKTNSIKSSSVELRPFHSWVCELFGKDETRFLLSKQRRQKLQLRIRELGEDRLKQAFTAVSNSKFHRGDNDRGWRIDTDPYWLVANYERAEQWANKSAEPADFGDERIDVKKLNLQGVI